MLTKDDLTALLVGFAAAIELDQVRADALPIERLNIHYSDRTWRMWRRDHLDYINHLLPTVDAIGSETLIELTAVALTRDPDVVGRTALNILAEAVSGSCLHEEVETAALFFSWLVKDVTSSPEQEPTQADAQAMLRRWLSVTDPLRIAEDAECGYGPPTGFIS